MVDFLSKIIPLLLLFMPLSLAEGSTLKAKNKNRTTAATETYSASNASTKLLRQLNIVRSTSGIREGGYTLVDRNTPNCFDGNAALKISEQEIVFELGPRIKLPALQQIEPTTTHFEADPTTNSEACNETINSEVLKNKLRFVASGDCWGNGWSQTMEIEQNTGTLVYTSRLSTGIRSDAPEQQTQICRYRRVGP